MDGETPGSTRSRPVLTTTPAATCAANAATYTGASPQSPLGDTSAAANTSAGPTEYQTAPGITSRSGWTRPATTSGMRLIARPASTKTGTSGGGMTNSIGTNTS